MVLAAWQAAAARRAAAARAPGERSAKARVAHQPVAILRPAEALRREEDQDGAAPAEAPVD